MPVIDRREPKPKKAREPAQPYQIHHPNVGAIDAQPRAGDYSVPVTYSVGDKVIGTGTLVMNRNTIR